MAWKLTFMRILFISGAVKLRSFDPSETKGRKLNEEDNNEPVRAALQTTTGKCHPGNTQQNANVSVIGDPEKLSITAKTSVGCSSCFTNVLVVRGGR